MNVFEDLADQAEREACKLEPWPSYYKLRAKEMESLFSMYKPLSYGRVLDIGSGVGFNAFLLDRFYDKTVAVDLYAEDARAHSLGVKRAKHFLDAMSYKDIEVISGRCECLPFRDDYFDSVYMFYTLEHIKERVDALMEIKRVLRPNGEAVVVVPAFLESLFYPLSFYRDSLKRVWSYLDSCLRRNDTKTLDLHPPNPVSKEEGPLIKRFLSSYPHFPFPEPHGEYPDYFSELIGNIPFVWFRLIGRSRLRIKEAFTTVLFPKELSSFFLGRKALDFYIKTLWMNGKFGRNPIFKYLGQNLCLILRKDNV